MVGLNTFSGGIFLENIELIDESGKELFHRLPQDGSGEIKYGAELTVRESQAAVFFYKGTAWGSFFRMPRSVAAVRYGRSL